MIDRLRRHRRVNSFAGDQGGAVAIIFSLSFLVLAGAIGLAVDGAYSVATRVTAALDSAALAAVTVVERSVLHLCCTTRSIQSSSRCCSMAR